MPQLGGSLAPLSVRGQRILHVKGTASAQESANPCRPSQTGNNDESASRHILCACNKRQKGKAQFRARLKDINDTRSC